MLTLELETFLALPIEVHAVLAFIIGLLTGSFLNVVILRFPVLMQHQWSAQSYEWLNQTAYPEKAPPDLNFPASHCPQCKTALKPWHNIPIISFIALKGQCASCQQSISWRYPLIELLTAVATMTVVIILGPTLQAFFGIMLTWVLIALSFIDLDTLYLPDDIVLPTLWLGLGLSLIPVFADPQGALIGAIAGYLFFWIIFHVFKRLTGKEGMGHGDFKLLALLGAWLGWIYLPQIVLISTLLGSVIGVSMILIKREGKDKKIPFGPYIAVAGWIALLWGDAVNRWYLSQIGG